MSLLLLFRSRSYVLACAAGAFAVAGNNAGLAYGHKVSAGTGTFSENGVATSIVHGRTLTPSLATFTESGVSAGLVYGHKIAPASGAFVLTGVNTAVVAKGYGLAAVTRSFAASGPDASLRVTRQVATSVGVFTEVGNAASIRRDRTIASSVGPFALSSPNTGLVAARSVAPIAGAFVLTGTNTALSTASSRTIAAVTGVFTSTGRDAAFVLTRRLTAGTGILGLTGQSAGITYSGGVVAPPQVIGPGRRWFGPSIQARIPQHYSLITDGRRFTLNGKAADLVVRNPLATGRFVLTGEPAHLSLSRRIKGLSRTPLVESAAIPEPSQLSINVNRGAFVLDANSVRLMAARNLVTDRDRFRLTRSAALMRVEWNNDAEALALLLMEPA